MIVANITSHLEKIAPLAYQESYDNSGLITGSHNQEITGILVSLDCTEEIIDEAIQKGCNMIVAHHPIIFKGLKKLNGKDYVERTIIKAIKNDIAIYAIHTNLDNVVGGVSDHICERLGLQKRSILAPKGQLLAKLTTFVPQADKDKVLTALSDAGAGHIGNYQECSFQTNGVGTFKPNDKANPHIGENGKLEQVEETRIEVIFPSHIQSKVLRALQTAHPYEEVAYYLHQLENVNQEVGSGMVGSLENEMEPIEFLKYLKDKMELSCIRHTKLTDGKIKKVAVCGGAGSFLLHRAKAAGADIYITGDFKYHEFFDAEEQIIIADIGHYESEIFTKDILVSYVKEQAKDVFPVISCDTNTNPIQYFV
ncbi:Nif3-like dinuclear metal center hexameric protein [Sediminitomix flava]|uniref:GTP cyclohydrolase 1 type 2 homolog n=1 Tax=Sediminitomix flava TaxID=379075 RepID=A0A315Z8J6_SEDFL|nr:Nif3-like dinuclear metal center hexameric protein [Sediminitomix flava]PWJ41821.1 dinuclear metal center YbgI/SA1388 family protein [Sediminitomix flava]